jgi:hypothetical protein
MTIARRVDGSDPHTSGVTALSVALSSVPVDGDMLIAIVFGLLVTDPTAAPSGFTLLGSQAGGANSKSWVYYKTASGESGTYAWSLASQVKSGAWVGAYSGVDTTVAPVFASSNPGSAAALACPGVTVGNSGWLISAACCRHSSIATASTWTDSDASDSERLDFGSGTSGSDIAMSVYDSNRALTAGSYARTLTSTNTEGQIGMWSIALAAAGAPVTPSVALPGRWGVYQ